MSRLPFRPALLVHAGVFLLCAGLAAAQSAPPPAPPRPLVVMLEAAPSTLDPIRAADAYGVRIAHQLLFETLLRIDDDLRIAPGVATAWSRPGPRRVRLTIRRGSRFQQGEPLDAEDVVYTLESLLDPASGSPHGAALREKVAAVRVRPPDGVEIELTAPYASILADLIVPVRSRRSKAPHNGSGPFKLAAQSPTEIVLERNGGYHGARPGVDRVVFKVVQDENTRLLKFMKGDVDLAVNAVPLDQLRQFRAPSLARRYEVVEAPGLSFAYLGFNVRDPILARREVRRALAHAINVDALVKHRQKGHSTRAAGVMPPGGPFAARTAPPAYDPALARRLLDEAGLPERGGPRFALTYKTSSDRSAIIQARVIQADLRKVGVAVEVRSYEWATFYEDIQKGNFQLFSLRWIGVADPDFQYELFHSTRTPPQGRNRGYFSHPEADRLLEAGRLELDAEKRRVLYRRLEELLAQELPYVNLWHNNNVAIVSRRYTGFRLHPSGGFQHLAGMRPVEPIAGGGR